MTDDLSQEPESLEQMLEALTEKERMFCELFAGDCAGNGTASCRKAGYAGDARTLAVTAYRLLRKPKIRAVLTAFQEMDERVANRVERLRFLTRVMRGEEKEPRVVGRDDDGAPIVEQTEPILRDRLVAQEALSKLAGEQVTKLAATNAQGEDVKSLGLEMLFTLAGLSGRVE
jgi:phage terminase small subunit